MWNCRVLSDRTTEYGAYTKVFDNLVGFVTDHERSAPTYIDLIEENRALFLEANGTIFPDSPGKNAERYQVVEPRELLFLLNHIDSSDRFYWAPRPYRRSGDITTEYLFICPENDTLACIYCGYKRPVPDDVKRAPVDHGITRASIFDGTSLAPTAAVRVRSTAETAALNQIQTTVMVFADRSFQHNVTAIGLEILDDNNGGGGGVDETDYDRPPVAAPVVTTNNNTQTGPPRTPRYHFNRCPILWLDKNCEWVTKNSKYQIHEPSKFGNALQLLQRARGRSMATEMEWNEFVQLTGVTTVMGACKDTLLKCYRLIAQMKLDNVDRHHHHGDSREFRQPPLYTVYYNRGAEEDDDNAGGTVSRPEFCRPLALVMEHSNAYGSSYRTDKRSEAVDETYLFLDTPLCVTKEMSTSGSINCQRVNEYRDERNEYRNYLSQLLSSRDVSASRPLPPTPAGEKGVYAIDAETARRAFVMHGFCVRRRGESRTDGSYSVEVAGDFSQNEFQGYRIRHEFTVPAIDMVCIYCGYAFTSRLCDPEIVDGMYDRAERTSIVDYLLDRSPRATLDAAEHGSWVWWTRKPGPNGHLALSVDEVTANGMDESGRPLDTNDKKLALWLSASLNLSHSSKCIFRVNGSNWATETCPICLVVDVSYQKTLFTCGHTLCDTCINDVRLAACPLCKRGTRLHRITVNSYSSGL